MEKLLATFCKKFLQKTGVYARFQKYLPQEIQKKCHFISTQRVYEIILSMVTEPWIQEVGKKYF